jgi:hypothetical protein
MHQVGFTTLLKGNLSGVHLPCVIVFLIFLAIPPYVICKIYEKNYSLILFDLFLLIFHANT